MFNYHLIKARCQSKVKNSELMIFIKLFAFLVQFYNCTNYIYLYLYLYLFIIVQLYKIHLVQYNTNSKKFENEQIPTSTQYKHFHSK